MTALIGKKFEDSVLIMADKRVSYRGTSTFRDDEKKIMVLNPNVIFAFAGVKNIIDMAIQDLSTFSGKTMSLAAIEEYSQEVFGRSLKKFKAAHPAEDYATVYLLAGFERDGMPRVMYFSSDDEFQKGHPLDFFYKTFPNTEMKYLRNYLENHVDTSKKNLKYYLKRFSSAIRQINSEKVSRNAYAIFLSKNGLFEIEIDQHGKFKIHPFDLIY
ncbi:hypothetical protein V7200_17015 [Cytobacillus firmus]|uniref:Proteasome subunit beta n=1 Tax=Cytobacillus firmus TaxID=1399 RepID=A0A800MYB4_CYTFI|nr:hypothetical protein [Cytobacillus firmus]KAF0824657.1 hypothetical protein KIS1582_1578 [Cytobacillus firmus]